MSARLIVLAAVVAASVAGCSVPWQAQSHGAAPDTLAGCTQTWAVGPPAPAVATATATMVRTDVVSRQTVQGTIGYAATLTVFAPGGSSGGSRSPSAGGVYTWLAPVGSAVQRGQRLYEVSGRPIPVFYGERPMWRRLAIGVSGPDVQQLEDNLLALGFTSGGKLVADGSFRAPTRLSTGFHKRYRLVPSRLHKPFRYPSPDSTRSLPINWCVSEIEGRGLPEGIDIAPEQVFDSDMVRLPRGPEDDRAGACVVSGGVSMNAQATDRLIHVTDAVERSLLVATCLWGGQCYGPCPHHSASHQDVKEALDWLEQHPAEVRSWEERRAAGLPPLGLLVSGHVGELDGPVWECNACGFRFDAAHVDPAGGYSCPNCEAALLRELLSSLVDAVQDHDYPAATAAIVKERLRMWDAAAGVLDHPLDRTATCT